MPATTMERAAPTTYMQGIAVPQSSVNPTEFFARTRRHINTEKVIAYAGQSQDVVELRKSDILSGILIRLKGQIVITIPSGTASATARWPYDFLRGVAFTANGVSNLINVSGLKLKVRDVMKKADLTDRGVTQTFGGVARNQGTLARSCESWGVGSLTNLTAGTYDVELEWYVPVSEDEFDLTGAIFLATSSSDLTLRLDYESMSNLFALTGGATAAWTAATTIQVASVKFSIPIGGDGQIVVPDLSVFHSLIQTRVTGIQNGENEIRLVGQGAGKSLLRLFHQVYNGAGNAAAPLSMNNTNFGRLQWRYANNETPDEFLDGSHMRCDMERRYNSDVGLLWGVGCHDFVHENAFRDVVDMGTTSELRFVMNIQSGVTLTSAATEYVTETVFRAD